MDEALQHETSNLTEAWMQHDTAMLGEYLVSAVEDPRLNVQSVLTRHFLIVALFGTRFQAFLEAELQFAVVLNWLEAVQRRGATAEDRAAIAHALAAGADNAEGLGIPKFVLDAYRRLPLEIDSRHIPNYIELWLRSTATAEADNSGPPLPETVIKIFECLWAEQLRWERKTEICVLEPACGSANDFRYFERFGLARLFHYTGFDLCEKNVRNARQLYPDASISQGNVFAIDAPEQSFDYCVVHDLFEHLSIAGLEQALTEICRVSRRGLCLGFFNAHEADEHWVQPVDKYHWNRLSVPRLQILLQRRGFQTQVVHIDTFLKWRFACDQTHNKNAYTLFGERS
jgi:SAM-dependent methyltransferase